jgi:hypothetical protein
MRRLHLFEFMDLEWYPSALRKYQTNILQVMMMQTTAFDYAAPYIAQVLEKTGSNTIVDLCSGASGPWLRLYEKLGNGKIQIILTDKFPNIEKFEAIQKQTNGRITFINHSIDALAVPAELKGLRTIFTGFHHFRRAAVKQILTDAQEKKQAICIFDYVPDKVLTLFLFPITFVISVLQFYFLSFFVRPITFLHIIFTNIIPVVPLVSAWDGFVSALRKYDAIELSEIVRELDCSNYKWEIGNDHSLSKATLLTYLIGIP